MSGPKVFRGTLTAVALAAMAVANQANADSLTITANPTWGSSGSTTGTAPRVRVAGGAAVSYGDIIPFWGDINPFYGDIGAFYGDINPFYGDIGAFWGDINPFATTSTQYGDINPFWGDINPFYGDITPFWGDITPFWGDINPFYGDITPFDDKRKALVTIGTFWTLMAPFWTETNAQWSGLANDDSAGWASVQGRLNELVTKSESVWGKAVLAKTGLGFRAGFADALFAKYGINLNDANSLKALTAQDRAKFYLDWYDGLMGFSGTDHVDWWMRAVNWTPVVTRDQGSGLHSTIGILDSAIINDVDLADNISFAGGSSAPVNGHGTGVASLIYAAHDGRGVMGIAPSTNVVTYNPFDASSTANWADISKGIAQLDSHGASVINLSLGVKNTTLDQKWRSVFVNAQVRPTLDDTVFVIAAGNDGVSQTNNLDWSMATRPAFIVVGSVNPDNEISYFSNRPGTSCLLQSGVCNAGQLLMDRFLVAPGENLLVSDGLGGVVRRSGTSFAAPLVSGAITLLHDFWPWMKQYPNETVDILLRSAKDLGAPGTDPVYGRGLLDVTASQAPLNFNNLYFYKFDDSGYVSQASAASVLSTGIEASWEANGAYFIAYENIGNTYRDFAIPLSSRLYGQTVGLWGDSEYFQSFIYSRLTDWLGYGEATTGFSDVRTFAYRPKNGWHMSVSAGAPLQLTDGQSSQRVPHTAFSFANDEAGVAFVAGVGQGSLGLNRTTGFGLASDRSATEGGVNPILGFASGGAFTDMTVAVAKNIDVSFGITQQKLVHSEIAGLSTADRAALENVDPYKASAVNMSVTFTPTDSVRLTAAYTRLDEKAGILGVQSNVDGDLAHGSTSDAATLGADVALTKGLSLAASATVAKTSSSSAQALSVGKDGVLSTAFAISATKQGLFGKRDMLRLSAKQPLHIEQGQLEYTTVGITDRVTGERGEVSQAFDIANDKRRYVGELLYAAPVLSGKGEVSMFGRADFNADGETGRDAWFAGARFRLNF
jgi:hypothetical protein